MASFYQPGLPSSAAASIGEIGLFPSGSYPDAYLLESPGVTSYSSIWTVLLGVLLAVIILALIVIFIYFMIRSGDKTFYPPVDVVVDNTINDTTGASSNGLVNENNGNNYRDAAACTAGPTREWSNDNIGLAGSCHCLPPFFGPDCLLESYACDYTAIGQVDQSDVTANVDSVQIVDRLSFPFTTNPGRLPNDEVSPVGDLVCTQLCDQMADCVGVWWNQAKAPQFGIGQTLSDKPTCQLISGDVVVNPGTPIPYDPLKQSTLYLKKNVLLQFKDRVFVYRGRRPLRYWLAYSYRSFFGDDQLQTMFQKQLINFNWTPQQVINTTGTLTNSGWYGFFSSRAFSTSNFKLFQTLVSCSMNEQKDLIIYNQQEYLVVSPTQTKLNIPTYWPELWGTFLPLASNDSNNNQSDLMNSEASRHFSFNSELNFGSQAVQSNTQASTIFNSSNSEMLEPTDYLVGTTINNGQSGILSNQVYNINWNTFAFPRDGSGKSLQIKVGENLHFLSTDDDYHDIVSTDASWVAQNYPINVPISRPLDMNINFDREGYFYLKDRMNPTIVRMTIIVTS